MCAKPRKPILEKQVIKKKNRSQLALQSCLLDFWNSY